MFVWIVGKQSVTRVTRVSWTRIEINGILNRSLYSLNGASSSIALAKFRSTLADLLSFRRRKCFSSIRCFLFDRRDPSRPRTDPWLFAIVDDRQFGLSRWTIYIEVEEIHVTSRRWPTSLKTNFFFKGPWSANTIFFFFLFVFRIYKR